MVQAVELPVICDVMMSVTISLLQDKTHQETVLSKPAAVYMFEKSNNWHRWYTIMI